MIFLLFSYSVFLCTSKNINECNKLWGMNNEINGVTVSNIGIYMCIDDPLNIYSTSNINSQNNLILSNEQLDIQNFNETIQRKINNTYNISNITEYFSITTNNPTTTTNNPTTTTNNPTTFVSTTTELSTTTEVFSDNENNNLNYQFNQSSTKKSELENINIAQDNTIVIIVTSISTISIGLLLFCCYRLSPITKKLCKKCYNKCTNKINEKKELPVINKNKKQRRITPSKINTNHVIDMPPQVITPKRKVSLGFNTNNMS